VNSVTMGNYERPLEISRFVKELSTAFQILNLKNDNLRKRFDSIKYDVKKIEEGITRSFLC
jgi:Translin family